MSEYKICKRCVMDTNGDPSITFDENGYCNYCTEAIDLLDQEKEQINEQKLKALFDKIKQDCKDDPYDCLVGVSGGLDSCLALLVAINVPADAWRQLRDRF